ncbi:MAG: tetratricopeptide repeat protein, partial [bacterium]|nr:tetratricopeptide repeat protein [bacterium]
MKPRTLLSSAVACLLLVSPSVAQTTNDAKQAGEEGRADAYYHFALGHLYHELAAQYGNRGEYLDKAIDNYLEALKADPAANFLADELSTLYIQAGRLREGVEEAKAAIERNPDDINARRILGRIHFGLGGDRRQNQGNEEMVERAIEQDTELHRLVPKDVKVLLILGRLHKIAQDSVASEEAYKKVLEIESDHEDALIGLAMVYADLGDQPRAAEMLRLVVAKNPTSRTLIALARSYEQQNEPALAAEVYRKAYNMDSSNRELKRSLAQNLMYANQPDEALRLFQELVGADPEDYGSHLRISQIHNSKANYDEAWAALEEAKKGSPDNLEVLYHEVNLLESSDRTGDAIARLEEILEGTKKATYSNGERSNRTVFLERLGLLYRADEQYD